MLGFNDGNNWPFELLFDSGKHPLAYNNSLIKSVHLHVQIDKSNYLLQATQSLFPFLERYTYEVDSLYAQGRFCSLLFKVKN